MGCDEMINVRDLDTPLLAEHKDRIWFYYSEKDDWVGNQREAVLRAVDADPEYARVVHGHRDIPHSFCISEWCVAVDHHDTGSQFQSLQSMESKWQHSVTNGWLLESLYRFCLLHRAYCWSPHPDE
jgi:hypothetical protein